MEKAESLKKYLFKPWWGEMPLFASQKVLAHEIANQPGSRYYGKEKSLIPFLNHILNERRPCPKELALEIIKTAGNIARIQTAAHKGTVPDAREVELVLQDFFSDAGVAIDLVEMLLMRQARAREVVTINLSPVPAMLNLKKAEPLSRFYFELFASAISGEKRHLFVFNKNSHRDIQGFWTLLIAWAEEAAKWQSERFKIESGGMGKWIEQLSAENRIMVLGAEPICCVVPLVVFDPEYRDAETYIWDYSEKENIFNTNSIARLSDRITNKWLNDFYAQIKQPAFSQPVRYIDANVVWPSLPMGIQATRIYRSTEPVEEDEEVIGSVSFKGEQKGGFFRNFFKDRLVERSELEQKSDMDAASRLIDDFMEKENGQVEREEDKLGDKKQTI